MIDPVTGGLIGAGFGILKHSMVDRPMFKEQAKVEAMKTAYAPILGTMGDVSKKPSGIQSALDFGVKGAVLGKALGGEEVAKAGAKGAAGGLNAAKPSDVQQIAFSQGAGPVSQQGGRDFLAEATQKAMDKELRPFATNTSDLAFDPKEVGLDMTFDGTTFGAGAQPLPSDPSSIVRRKMPDLAFRGVTRPIGGFGSGRSF